MSETTKNIESPDRRFPGTPVTREILEKVLAIYDAESGHNLKKWEPIRIEFHTKDGDERPIVTDSQNPGLLLIIGPHFTDTVDLTKPETFELLDLIISDDSLARVETNSTPDKLEEIRNSVKNSPSLVRLGYNFLG